MEHNPVIFLPSPRLGVNTFVSRAQETRVYRDYRWKTDLRFTTDTQACGHSPVREQAGVLRTDQ
jgi:hypothetical protein